VSKIDELIHELCPNGVEFKYVWEVTAWDKKFNAVDNRKQAKTYKYTYLLASALRKLAVEKGEVKLLSTGGEVYGYTTDELARDNISEGEIIAIPWGGKATVQYYSGKFVTADNRIATSLNKDYLDNKYLYYFMLNNLRVLQSFYRGSGIQHPSMAKVLDMRLPIPPIEVQKEIVDILDKFTQLEAELSAELSARKKQYAYYRNEMLTNKNWRMVALGDVCSLITKGTTPKAFATAGIRFIKTESFENNVINNDKTVYVSEQTHHGELKRSMLQKNDILFTIAGATIGKCASVEELNLPANTNQALAIIRLNTDVMNQRFVFYYLQSKYMTEYVAKKVKGSAQPNLNLRQLNEFSIPLPLLEDQENIVMTLDSFDAIVNDIKSGLPAEIKARRKQYEYYRTKLLTFQELAS
jgi:type I restriction enzyme, S subunit